MTVGYDPWSTVSLLEANCGPVTADIRFQTDWYSVCNSVFCVPQMRGVHHDASCLIPVGLSDFVLWKCVRRELPVATGLDAKQVVAQWEAHRLTVADIDETIADELCRARPSIDEC